MQARDTFMQWLLREEDLSTESFQNGKGTFVKERIQKELCGVEPTTKIFLSL